MISSRVLPWIGGPSRSSSPGLHAEAPDAVEDDRRDEHEDRHGDDHQDVPQRVDRLGLVGGGGREPVDQEAEARCRASDAITPIASSADNARARAAACTSRPASAAHQLSSPMEAASYRTAGTEGTDAADPGAGACGASGGEPSRRPRDAAAAGAVVRRRDAEVAPERLGELRGLAVADAVRDLADRQRCGGRAARRRAPSGRGSGARGRSCCRPRRTRAGAGGGRRRRGGRCRRARARRRTRAPRWRSRPRTGSCGARRWRGVAWARSRIRADRPGG